MTEAPMSNAPDTAEPPFQKGDWVIDRNNPGQPGQYTGLYRPAGPHIMVQLVYPNGGTIYRPLAALEAMPQDHTGSLEERLKANHFGKLRDFQRLITYEKLKGTLHEIIYSMEAAQIDFYPYQFKPVLKFINSPTDRLIIADEVGLGKTIEAALIWIELQARRQARRLLVVCPKILAAKWRDELRSKFLIDARLAGFEDLEREVEELKKVGPGHAFALIATYTGLRPPKDELRLLDDAPGGKATGSAKTVLLRDLRHWSLGYVPFDLVIFDEAHYMRNPATTVFHLGEGLAANAGAVLCVSATPVNNSNTDLHSLLRLVDENFFESQVLFNTLLDANRPAVQAGNALARDPVDMEMLRSAVEGMAASRFINQSPLFKQFLAKLEQLDAGGKTHLAKCQDLAEKLNLFGNYINRTRRVQVKEHRPLRVPLVLNVEYSPEEMQLYKAILKLVRRKCFRDRRPFHVFQVIGLQLRAASCLPMVAQEIREGRFGDIAELMNEALGGQITDEMSEEELGEDGDAKAITQLLAHDFVKLDSKYRKLRSMLKEELSNEKVVIFAYYRLTLSYLARCLTAEGYGVALIHGGLDNMQRWEEIQRFKDSPDVRVLLSSEVGSEGIDLQFCRSIVNYDLPWNPMRVEQRIGRIDRVGQEAKRLSIVNFKVRDTVEERLYERLHEKIARFANSLGDLESIIGNEVQRLTIELLSKDLTPEEERKLMDQAEQVIEGRLLQVQALEESGDTLLALSDYIQRKIEDDRAKGRYIQPDELEDYLCDFFEREFQGTEINHNTPADGCLRIRLSLEARDSLSSFIRDDNTLSARPLRQKEFAITFRRDALQRISSHQRGAVHFCNHLSPLIRWITKINWEREHGFFNVSALRITYKNLPLGDYCYRIERWEMRGHTKQERLAYGIRPLTGGITFSPDESEATIQHILRRGEDWTYVECDNVALLDAHAALEQDLGRRFDIAAQDFYDENETIHQIKVQRVKGFFDRRIAQHEQRLQTLLQAGRDTRVVRLAEGQLRTARENKEQRFHELNVKAKTDQSQTSVAAGIFRVVATQVGE